MSDSPPPDEDETPLPTIDELEEETDELPEDNALQFEYERDFWGSSTEQELAFVRLRAIQDHYAHKGKWSYFLMGVMLLMVIFQSVLLGLVGVGVWDFTKYEWLLPLLLVQNLAQIVGLAVFVVKALFKDIK